MGNVDSFSAEFERLHCNLIEVLNLIPEDRLYWKPFESASFLRVYSCAELIVHIGAVVEYTFNGITSNFWDDPFEWTLREHLSTHALVAEYLEEAARVRRLAFEQMTDQDLSKTLYFPNGAPSTISELLLRALSHAAHHRGQVYAYVHLFSNARLPAIDARVR
ncbi:MAG: hypothetical protein DMF61_02850 [Blastocatellia bacterium AA13]|nr:MAG: hypothetical protein DMF61_02850 [Blastocatellia bacterium AA13]